jgi:hypothetical protein
VAGGLTPVLSPDDVMGAAVWAEEVRQANDRTREKPNVRKGINRKCSPCCFFKGKPPLGIGAFTPHALTAG